MWSPAVASGAAIDDTLRPMCLDDLLSREASRPMSPDHHCDSDDNWEMPINGGFLDSEPPIRGEPPAECNEDDGYEVPMVPLESVGGGAAPPPPPNQGMPESVGPSQGKPQ